MQRALAFSMPSEERRGDGVMLLRHFATARQSQLIAELDLIVSAAPFRNMETPGGFRMSVAMTNCGAAGWVTDRRGYRYEAHDPATGLPWPPMPAVFAALALEAAARAGFDGFTPDSCLINRYAPGASLSPHQDRNEMDFSQPIVSVSLGLPALFLFGGPTRAERPRRLTLEHGDVVVWGGPARLAFHGVAKLADGAHTLVGRLRYNLTFRNAL